MGVKPLGKRPWNTGPGDATAVQLLRGELDRKLPERLEIPAGGQRVVVRTVLPARGIANGLLRGRSNGPFTMAVVASEQSAQDSDLFAVLRSGRLAPGRIYLNRIREIQLGRVFSRVAGVALGDAYKAEINHDLSQGSLHVPLTSTKRHHFGTRDIQGQPINNTDGGFRSEQRRHLRGALRRDAQSLRRGSPSTCAQSPVVSGKKTFTAFRGSLQIVQDQTLQEVHVGMRSGESLALSELNLAPGTTKAVKVSLVYPADATPGHLLSVVPVRQLAMLHRRQKLQRDAQVKVAETKARKVGPKTAPPKPQAAPVVVTPAPAQQKQKPTPAPVMPAVVPATSPRYRVIRSQQQWLLQLQGR